jgi:hypothetical protein
VAMENLLARGVDLRLKGLSGACQDILDHKEALFTFAFKLGCGSFGAGGYAAAGIFG